MSHAPDQVLTVAQMRAAEDALIAAGTSVDDLMQRAGRGAADYVWRIAAGRTVTVLCGPGNNGGDGYVIAEALRERGTPVRVVAPLEPKTAAAQLARSLYQGAVCEAPKAGAVLVDCLFGSGLTRPLSPEHTGLLAELSRCHPIRIAIDLPSGVDADLGLPLNHDLPDYQLTLALGAWKPAHFLMPACAAMGAQRLVGIGLGPVAGAAEAIARPRLTIPPAYAHKYTRGLLAVVAGAMPGAAVLAAVAAQGAGAGYIKVLGQAGSVLSPDLVVDTGNLAEALTDRRIAAVLIGPGLGRDGLARERLAIALSEPIATVLDADALVLLGARQLAERTAPLIATPHEGELFALERAFALDGSGSKAERALALAKACGMVIVAKGADTLVAAPDGRLGFASRASSWLSTAGTGDVLAGTVASRLATGQDAFRAACEGVWLHGEAARRCDGPFAASALAARIADAYAACL